MKVKGSRRIVRRLGLALAVAAVLAPSAQAVPQALDSGGPTATTEQRGYAQINPQARPDLVQRYEVRGYAPINEQARPDLVPPPSEVVRSNSSEFSWGDASIGAGIVFGVMLIGVAIVFTRNRTRLAAA